MHEYGLHFFARAWVGREKKKTLLSYILALNWVVWVLKNKPSIEILCTESYIRSWSSFFFNFPPKTQQGVYGLKGLIDYIIH